MEEREGKKILGREIKERKTCLRPRITCYIKLQDKFQASHATQSPALL